jgi:threonine/homoserine/homoserine lactone efflux protein
MDLHTIYIVIGIAIGFLVAAPIGPIGIFCIRQASANGLFAGIITGLGASIADAVYTIVAGYGASFVEKWIKAYMHWFELIGGVFFNIYRQ